MAKDNNICISYKIEGEAGSFKKIIVDAESLQKLLQANITEAEKLKKSFLNFATMTNGIKNVDKSISELCSGLDKITGESLNFDKAMKAANTMAGKDSAGFKELKDDVAALAKQLPIARDELANGLYQVISNGVPEDNWLEFLNASARSAVGGIADINKVVGVTSTVIKNYGLEWSAAADIQDKIQLTAKNGVTSFEQLAQALPRVTGNAATLGVSIDELMGTFATLTGVSGNTAEVSTQLAAIFTALVKPSSEATKMAEKMGIQFDAAAIKASGGFQQFLSNLDASIKTYAQANGVLEQEVYAKLFGSAESLRALIPLQGELSEKFTSNVAAMVDSAGTMDAAFKDMSSTGEAVTQMLKNKYAAIVDVVAGLVSGIQPYLNFSAGLASTAANSLVLVQAFKQLHITQHLVAMRTKLLTALLPIVGLKGKSAAAVIRIFSSALKGGAYSATAFKVALRGVLLLTGIGAAIVAVTTIISHFSNTVDDATDSVKKLDDASDEYTRAAADAKVQIDNDKKSLEELIKAKKSTKEAIDHLNETYGEIFGQYKTDEEWHKILTEKSQLYVKQMGYEAQARALVAKVAEASINRELAAEKKAELERSGKNKTTVSRGVGGGTSGNVQAVIFQVDTDEYRQACKDLEEATAIEEELQKRLDFISDKASEVTKEINNGLASTNKSLKVNEMNWDQVDEAIKETEKSLKKTIDPQKIKELSSYNAQLKARKKLLETQLGFGTQNHTKKKTEVADPKTEEELSTNIEIYKKKLTNEDTEEQRIFREKIARWQALKDAIADKQKEAERPKTLTSLEDINREISYQRTLRSKATKDNIAEIDAEIDRLETLADEIESAAHIPLPLEEIKSYQQLNKELSYYSSLHDKAKNETERGFAQEKINQLNDLKKTWDQTLDALKQPADISSLNSIEKLDEALSYYEAKQKQASADEIQNIQKTIDAHVRKREALQRGIEIPTMAREAEEINKLTGCDYKLKIRGMGFDELTEKIRDLQRMLDDMDHPVTESQRKDIESLIRVYEQWRKEGVNTFDTYRSGWDGLKTIGSGIENLTSVLEGNGNAWQKITAIIDGFLQIYDGIKTIVGIINMLSMATTAHTAAKSAEATAIGVSSGAQTAEAMTSEAAAAAQIPVIAANKLATASYMELAAAAYFAAHASIPFAGFGIASGFVASATAMVEAIGVMPFADGGIVSGPTIGLIGEYAGAKNNPEVIAPLDKLRNLIEPKDSIGGKVTFHIAGRTLVGILEKETNLKNRS